MSWFYTKTPAGWELQSWCPPRWHHLFTENGPHLFHKRHYSPSVCVMRQNFICNSWFLLIFLKGPQQGLLTAVEALVCSSTTLQHYGQERGQLGWSPHLSYLPTSWIEGAVGMLEETPSEQGLLGCLLQGGISCKQLSADVLVPPRHTPFKLLLPHLVLCMYRLHGHEASQARMYKAQSSFAYACSFY